MRACTNHCPAALCAQENERGAATDSYAISRRAKAPNSILERCFAGTSHVEVARIVFVAVHGDLPVGSRFRVFELNGLFKWLLEEIGFDVTMMAGYVGKDRPDRTQGGDHMLLRVDCDGPLLVDVGFGGGMCRPVPLLSCGQCQPPYDISVRKQAEGFFTYHEKTEGNEAGYCFAPESIDTKHFETANHDLQTNADSPFIRTLTAQRRDPDCHIVLRGLVLKKIEGASTKTDVLSSSIALTECLQREFGLEVPNITACWPELKQRHDALFAA